MNVVAHDAEGIELEAKNALTAPDRIQQQFSAGRSGQSEFPVIATNGDVIAILGL